MAEEIGLENYNFRNFRSPVTLTQSKVKTLDWVIRPTIVHQLSISIYTPNFIEI